MWDTSLKVEPDLVELKYGGWLATTPRSASLRIGVVGISKADARERFASSLRRWKEIYEAREKENSGQVEEGFGWAAASSAA